MADLVYYSQCSLDGLIADEGGDFSWAFPPEDVHRAANEVAARTGIHLLGRRTYDVMRYWDEEQVVCPRLRPSSSGRGHRRPKWSTDDRSTEWAREPGSRGSSTRLRRERSPMRPIPR